MILTIDIGGTAIKYGYFDQDLVELGSLPTLAKEPGFNMLVRLDEVIQQAQSQIDIRGIAISSAGTIDPIAGTVVQANENLPGYTGTNLKEALQLKYDVPVTVVNDADAALLGELHYGRYVGHTNAVMLTVGTGLGCAIVVNNDLLVGHSFSAGEVGYLTWRGHPLESVISTTALVAEVQMVYPDERVDGRLVFEKAQAGDHVAQIAIDRLLNELDEFIKLVVAFINPSIVILGGGIMEQKELLAQKVQTNFATYPNPLVKKHTQIDFATLGNLAGMYGAYYWYKQQIEHR